MDLPGLRYRNLATRCRHSATVAPNTQDRAALLTMAIAYDRRPPTSRTIGGPGQTPSPGFPLLSATEPRNASTLAREIAKGVHQLL